MSCAYLRGRRKTTAAEGRESCISLELWKIGQVGIMGYSKEVYSKYKGKPMEVFCCGGICGFVSFWQGWGLNPGLHEYQTNNLPLSYIHRPPVKGFKQGNNSIHYGLDNVASTKSSMCETKQECSQMKIRLWELGLNQYINPWGFTGR